MKPDPLTYGAIFMLGLLATGYYALKAVNDYLTR